MILIPNMDSCTFITEDGYCTVAGTPLEIVHNLFVKRVDINPKLSVIMSTVKEVSVLINGDIVPDIYCAELESNNIKVKRIHNIHPQRIFKEVEWIA